MRTFRSSGALVGAAGAFVVSTAGAIAFASGAAATTIMPHRAFYEMQLGIADQNSNVQTVSGRSAFTLGRECDGWRFNDIIFIGA
ncbi:MAG: EipB family protein, partial [Candidatus Puniceispirillaceae bacterium]